MTDYTYDKPAIVAEIDELDRHDIIDPLKEADEKLSYTLPDAMSHLDEVDAQRVSEAIRSVRQAINNLEGNIEKYQRRQAS